jgi:hypothetical protein
MKIKSLVAITLFSFLFLQFKQDSKELSWSEITPEAKPGVYWWWMGSAVDKKGLDYNLKNLSDAGIGTVHVIPIYGVNGEERNYIDFLTPEWMSMLSYSAQKAGKLGMNIDMSTTTGWPFGGSHVTPHYASSMIEYEVINLSGPKTLHLKTDTSDLETVMAFSNTGRIIDFTKKPISNGTTKLKIPAGEWKIYILHRKGTEMKVKRAAPGNVGLVLDPFSADALKFYLERYNNAFADFPKIGLRAQYHDSYEYYRASWTTGFFDLFLKAYGYDLRDHLPALFDSTAPNPNIKADYRRLLADLHLEYIKTWSEWSHSKGWITRNEAHGAPGNLLDLYAASDIPETETFGARELDIPGFRFREENNSTSVPPNPLILKFASSAAHVTGKNLIASETGTWLRDHYKTALSQVKPEVDELFFSGINHIFYHGNAYSPEDAQWPGWIFYASTHFEKENAFWNSFPELNSYVARCQSVLQSGKPANDILLYWPLEEVYHSFPDVLVKTMSVHNIDWFENFDFGKLATHLDEKGYSFDYISDKQLSDVSCEEGNLITHGNRYKVIVVPETKYIPASTLKQLDAIVANGGKVIFNSILPVDVSGFSHHTERRADFEKWKEELRFKDTVSSALKAATTGKGYFYLAESIDTALTVCDVKPEKLARYGLKFIRRINDYGYNYFITNLTGNTFDSWIPLSVDFQSALLLDPRFKNRVGKLAIRENGDENEVYLQLQPGESYIIRTFTDKRVNVKPWDYVISSGSPVEIKGVWKVNFVRGAPQLPKPFKTDKLKSWTDFGDRASISFAGTGRYTIEFEMPDINPDEWNLNLGKVCESARVTLNGKVVGTLWSFPFNINVGKYLKRGNNTLEIEVTNLSANRIRDLDRRDVNWKKFFFVDIFYKKFDASKWPVMESGLIGPVTLQPLKLIEFE